MVTAQEVLDCYADGVEDFRTKADGFRNLSRWTGDDPLLMLADATATTTGLSYLRQAKPMAQQFGRRFLDTGSVESFADLAELGHGDDDLEAIFEDSRKARVLVEVSGILGDLEGETDLERLQTWANRIDPVQYESDPVGQVNGIGLRTVQYLRMLAGVDTVKPDVQVSRFVSAVDDELGTDELSSKTDADTLRSCGWLANETTYRMIDIDQIAWWTFSENGHSRH